MDWIELVGIITSLVVVIITANWRQYLSIRNLIDEMKAEVLTKLEYHEQHDDTRFNQIAERFIAFNNDVWALKVRNAASDAQKLGKSERN